MIPYVILAAALLICDQWVKYWVVTHLALGQTAPLLPGFVELLRVHNYGAAWSSFSGMRWILIAVTMAIVVAVATLLARKKVRHPLGRTACWLIVVGGSGNILDRLRLGYVVDMFHFQFWPSYPVFNVADICVVSGAVLGLLYYLLFYDRYDRRR
jgi:signal peptidase II